MRFILPAPPSVNAMYRSVQGRVLKSKTYRTWLKRAEALVRKALIEKYPPHKRPDFDASRICVSIEYYPKDNRRRDIDNLAKPILDLFEGMVYDDDTQVDLIHIIRRKVNKALDENRVDVTITAGS